MFNYIRVSVENLKLQRYNYFFLIILIFLSSVIKYTFDLWIKIYIIRLKLYKVLYNI